MHLLLFLLACRPDPADPSHAVTSTADTASGPTSTSAGLIFDGPPPKHLLMISMDTLRRDALVRYGGEGTMPFLDGLFAEGVAADDHATCSNWTFHSTTCTMRGAYPEDWNFLPSFSLNEQIAPVPPGTEMLASWLGDAGFRSSLVSTNALFSEAHGNAQGFDTVVLAPQLGFTPASVAADEALAQLVSLADAERRYVHLHLMEPHQPYDPPEDWLVGLDALAPIPYDLSTKDGHNEALQDIAYGKVDAATAQLITDHMWLRYQGEQRWLDQQLSLVWEDLAAGGWLDDTLVVVWTDHGEQFFERGYQAHAWTLFAEENDGLLLFWSKGLASGAHTGPTSAIDLVPTVLDALGVAIPEAVDGLPLGQAPDDRPRFGTSAAKGGVFQSVRLGSDRLHFGWTDPTQAPPFAPYAHGLGRFDRATDPQELTNLASPTDPRTLELWELLRPRVALAESLSPELVTWPEGYAR